MEMISLNNPEITEVAAAYVPRNFPWLIFATGELAILGTIAWYRLIRIP